MSDESLMREALLEAHSAEALSEVPVGAIVVRNGEILSRAHNRRQTGKNALYHAEICAIDEACRKLGGWRLCDCTLYVTLEPCPMCAGAIVAAQLPRVVIGARDAKAGAFGGLFDLRAQKGLFCPEVTFGVLEEECAAQMTNFFKALRKNKK